VSVGIENTEEEVDILIEVLGEIAGKPRAPKDTPGLSNQFEAPVLNRKTVKKEMTEFVLASAWRVYH
jgi:hypothetical protein